jgi:hypothetical protein
VYVEFLIAFLPFFIFFLCLWQLSIIYYARLVVDHAAFAGARAAAVIMAENPNRVDKNGGNGSVNQKTESREGLVRTAVELVLAPLIFDGTVVYVQVRYPPGNQPGGPEPQQQQQPLKFSPMTESSVSLMRVRVETFIRCRIAFAGLIACPPRFSLGTTTFGMQYLLQGFNYFILPVNGEAIFPYQGASYQYDPNDDTSGGKGLKDWANNYYALIASAGASNALGGGCFAAGTLVDTGQGLQPIETVQAGDTVMSGDEETRTIAPARVTKAFVRPEQTVVDVRLRGRDTIRATPGHPFWTADRGWVLAGELAAGETVLSETGDGLIVDGVDPVATRETVYNLEIEGTHTYFVGPAEAWVHNASVASGGGGPGGGGPGGGPGGGGPGGPGDPNDPLNAPIGEGPRERKTANQKCFNEVLDPLETHKDTTCAETQNSSCSTSKVNAKKLAKVPCSEVRRRIQAYKDCLAERQNIQDECYTSTDPGHQRAIDQEARGVASCEALEKINCAPGHPMADL